MKDDSLYVYVLRTDALILGVFVEKKKALAHGEAFAVTHSEMFPQEAARTVGLERHVVIGGTTLARDAKELKAEMDNDANYEHAIATTGEGL